MNNQEQREKVSSAWRTAAEFFSIRVEAPYLIKDPDGAEMLGAAYLPDFGGPNGTLVGIDFRDGDRTDRRLLPAAKARGMGISFLNPKFYENFDEEMFKRTLVDWGYCGSEERRPSWL